MLTPRVSDYGRQEQKAPDRTLAGTWHGVLEAGATKLRLVLNVARQADGSYKATLDSPDQDAAGIPVDSVTLKDSNVRVELKTIGGVYEGTLDAEGSALTGDWSQGGSGKLPPVFLRSDKPAPARPQEPKRPYPYSEEVVSYENRRAGVRLSATLTLPRGKGPHPAIVLITGSGMQDRDETVAGHKPFSQVPAKEKLSAIDGALKAGGNRNYKTAELPGLNHLFPAAVTGSPVE